MTEWCWSLWTSRSVGASVERSCTQTVMRRSESDKWITVPRCVKSFYVTIVNMCEYIHVDRKLFWGLLWNCVGSLQSVAFVLCAVSSFVFNSSSAWYDEHDYFCVFNSNWNWKKKNVVCTNIYILHSICIISCKYTNYYFFFLTSLTEWCRWTVY